MERGGSKGRVKKQNFKNLMSVKRNWQLYIMALPAILYILLFVYKPMSGLLIAFQDYSFKKGIWGSEWIGFENFERVFSSYWFPIILKNTLVLSLLSLVIGFPLPIILALCTNEMKSGKLKKWFQTISYAPHFISTVVMCGMIMLFLNVDYGVVNLAIKALGGEAFPFMGSKEAFPWVYVLSGAWQGMGWGAIIYYSALSGVDNELLDAAQIDGADKLQRIWHINLPAIRPTIIITLILRCGQLLSVGYEKVYLLQTGTNIQASETISTYVYKVGLIQSDFSYSTAVGLFNSVVNCIILLIVNKISAKVSETSLF